MIRHYIEQRSTEWHALRCGRFTASDAAAIMATGRGGGEAVARRDLRLRLAGERMTGRSESSDYLSDAMQHGIDTEARAVAAYEVETGVLVDTSVGFIEAEDCLAGYSPDGIAGEGLLEVKSPKTSTHIRYLRDPLRLSIDYAAQTSHALWITGAPWIDLLSFDDRLPASLALVRVRLVALPDYAALALAFLAEVDDTVRELTALSEAR